MRINPECSLSKEYVCCAYLGVISHSEFRTSLKFDCQEVNGKAYVCYKKGMHKWNLD